jgi:uncharacterized protein (TIGR02001 family)
MRGKAVLFVLLLASDSVEADSLTGTVTVTTDYRFRGISQTDLQPTPQASLVWNGPDGWYAGTWASRVDFDDHANTSIEWDIYVGKHFALSEGFDLNIQPYYYAYPDHDAARAGFNDSYFELITTLTRTFDPITVAGTLAWSPDWFAESGPGWWLNLNVAAPVNAWLSLSGNLGRQWARDLNGRGLGFPYSTWDVGATAKWRSFALDLRYIDTTISERECAAFNGARNGRWCGGAVLLTLGYSFAGAD